jgi:poly-gamma-glutamate capsule biosynthesis protein CapA/YwtB (metallophosphatase superfamily)
MKFPDHGGYFTMESDGSSSMDLFLCGDVMTGRGIDQVLSHPSDPVLHESYVRDARDYIFLAEKAHGPIPFPVSFEYIWGDALSELWAGADLRIVNLETSITRSDDYWPGKAIHYRMHPQNIPCLAAAHIDACSLANNHTLDWGYDGLAETVQRLDETGIAHSGAGQNEEEAKCPAILNLPGKGRILFFAYGSLTSGVSKKWTATRERAGLNVLDNFSQQTAMRIAAEMRRIKQTGDVTIASIHWGNNWDYEIPEEEITFARQLIDEGFDIVHGHSSHHVKAIEVYRERLILYGCGDFLTDYEGITGFGAFRGDLALMYFVKIDAQGRLLDLRLVPMVMRRFRLQHASETDASWVCSLLNQLGESFGTHFDLARPNEINLVVKLKPAE